MGHTPLRALTVLGAWVGLTALAACAQSHTAAPAPDESVRIDRVITGLRAPTVIQGESAAHWTLADRMQHYHVPGVSIAVVDSGRVVWARGFGLKEAGTTDSVTPTTLFQAASISKPVFAVGVMRLVQDGKLDLDQDVNAKLTSWHLPENRFTTHEKVTLRRILSHSAGVTVHGFPGYEVGAPIPTVEQILDGVKPANTEAIRVDTTPGAIYRYSGGGITVAMLLVTDVTKEPFPQFMQQTVLGPAGMGHSTYEQPLPSTRVGEAATAHDTVGLPIKGKYHTYPEMAAAGLWTTPSDLATLGIDLQRTYAGQTDSVISRATVQQMFTIQKAPYGIGFELHDTGQDLEFMHGGSNEGFRADFRMFASRGQGLVIMTNASEGGSLMSEIVPSVAAEYGWPAGQQLVRQSVPISAARLASYRGTYRIPNSPDPIMVHITAENGKLYLDAADAISKTEVLAESDSMLFARSGGYDVTFDHDRAGRVVAIRVFGMRGPKIK